MKGESLDQQELARVITAGHPSTTSFIQAGVVEGMAAKNTVTEVRARNASCDCPHCGAACDGWAADPRGLETTCDECGELFHIAGDARVLIT